MAEYRQNFRAFPTCGPSDKRLERTGGQLSYFMRAPVAAGRSTAGRKTAIDNMP
jgi:hypothetical protein